jgi:hypothetical protein
VGNLLSEVLRGELGALVRGASRDQQIAAKLRATLFQQQRDLLNDSAHNIRVACCSRRAGKTQGIMRGLLAKSLEVPGSICVYFVDTIARAKKLVWDGPDSIPTLLEEAGAFAACSLNQQDHRVDFANGSVLWITGCETLPDAKRWKGKRYTLAVIDECQDWPDEILNYLLDQVLGPALMDRDGEVILAGVPGPVLAGVFYEAASGLYPGWSVHHWTYWENPWIKNKETFLAKYLKDKGLSVDDPFIQREYFGRWVKDMGSLLYQYEPGRNDYVTLPADLSWTHVLGMDFGVRDLATFVLDSYRPYDTTVYTQEVHGEQGADVTRCADIVRGFQQQFGLGMRLIADCGALGLGYALELRNRHGLNVIAAEKRDKPGAIRLMNDQLRLGRIKLSPSCGPLKAQLQRIKIDPRTQIEKPASACDYADAKLYAWRDCYAYLAQEKPDESANGEQKRMVARILSQRARGGAPSIEQERRDMSYLPTYD